MHGCEDVVRIWQDLAKTAKMLVRGSTRVCIENRHFCQEIYSEKSFVSVS